jgi:hypothetical protein
MSNLDTWDKISRPPASALKKITGGRLNGKSDINPQWRMKAMTETFGPVGDGWKYTIDKLWTEEGSGGERMAFALVSVYTRILDSWSDPVPGIGGSMMIAQEKSGLYNSDEAYKMCVTDALSVAFKAFGMAAEIYMGNWDGSKYKDDAPNPKPETPQPEAPSSSHAILPILAKDQCSQLADNLNMSIDTRRDMFEALGHDYTKLLAKLKAKMAERDDKVAHIDDTLAQVWEAGK